MKEFAHHKPGEPIPEGWRIADQAPSHHGEHAVLIERDVEDARAAVRFDHIAGIELMVWKIGQREVEIVRLKPMEAMQLARDLLDWALLADARRRHE